MARHRNYRNYSYEDDLSDDVYGHSVEDYDLAVSPTTAEQFIFRRSNSRDPNLSSYMADRFGRVDEEDEEESEEETFASSQDYRRPQLDPTSEAKLSSCMDQLHSILGETLHEPTAVTAVLQSNFDLERALDQILSQGGKQDLKANLDPDESEDTSRAGRKEVKLLYPVQNHVSLDAKKAEAAPVVTSVQDKPVIGFSTPPVNNKKSRESSPENETETDQRQANKKQMEKDQLLAEAHEEYHKRRKGKTLLNLVVIGHVDAGKSTLMGHLLYLLGDVSKKAMHKYP